jgi:hypothetical protein
MHQSSAHQVIIAYEPDRAMLVDVSFGPSPGTVHLESIPSVVFEMVNSICEGRITCVSAFFQPHHQPPVTNRTTDKIRTPPRQPTDGKREQLSSSSSTMTLFDPRS